MTMERDKNYTSSMSRPFALIGIRKYTLNYLEVKNVLNVLSIESEMTNLYVDIDE